MATVGELAVLLNGTVRGEESLAVFNVSSVEDAEPDSIVIAENSRYLALASKSAAAAVVSKTVPETFEKTAILVEDPRHALLKLLDFFGPEKPEPKGIDPGCRIGRGFQYGENITIGFGAYIGDGVSVGDDVTISPLVYVGDNVKLGSGVYIHPNVTIYSNTQVGDRVVIHSGSVIGADGFGYLFLDGAHRKVPQLGCVVIEDDVEIGACTTVDRAKFGVTRIGRGTKIDNLVHVAHNCKVGENSVVVAQTGIAGSVVVGNGVVLAGQAGVKDHVTIGDGAVVAARAGVIGDVDPGSKVSGFPARDHVQYMRSQAVLQRLPELMKIIQGLEKKLSTLEARIARNGDEIAKGE